MASSEIPTVPTARPQLRQLATSGAWFFIIASLAQLAWVAGAKVVDPTGTAVVATGAAANEVGAVLPGMTFNGLVGLPLVIMQIVGVGAAAYFSVRGRKRSHRRIALASLLSWNALWLMNVLYLATVAPSLDTVCQTGVLGALLAATSWRTINAWSRRTPQAVFEHRDFFHAIANSAARPSEPERSWTRVVRDWIATAFRPERRQQAVAAARHGVERGAAAVRRVPAKKIASNATRAGRKAASAVGHQLQRLGNALDRKAKSGKDATSV